MQLVFLRIDQLQAFRLAAVCRAASTLISCAPAGVETVSNSKIAADNLEKVFLLIIVVWVIDCCYRCLFHTSKKHKKKTWTNLRLRHLRYWG